jgi:hypothetical protein
VSNYTKSTNFATKDTLATGNPSKIVKGTEIDTEFNAIASAVASKADTASPTFTGVPAVPTATAGSNTTQIANTAYIKTALEGIGGTIVQTVRATGTSASTTATGYVPTGHTATITPTSASSKILVLVNAMFWQTNVYANSANCYMALYRSGSNVQSGDWIMINANVNGASGASIFTFAALMYLDSPNTTSSITYQPYIRCDGGGSAVYNATANGTVTLLEIA